MRQIETNELASFPNSWLFFSLLNLDFSDCLKNGTGLPSSGTMKENQTLVFKNESHESFKRGFKKKKKNTSSTQDLIGSKVTTSLSTAAKLLTQTLPLSSLQLCPPYFQRSWPHHLVKTWVSHLSL